MLRLALFRPINSLPSLAQTRDDVPLLVSRDPFGSFKGRRMFNRKHYRHSRRYSNSNRSRCLSDRVFPSLTVPFIDHAIPLLSNNFMLTVGNNDLKLIVLEFNDRMRFKYVIIKV